MKRLTTALLIAAFILASGCADKKGSGTGKAEETTSTAAETTVYADIDKTEPSETEADTSGEAADGEVDIVPMFEAYYALADELHAQNDKLQFSFEGDKFLALDENDLVTPYHYENGAVKELPSESLMAGQGDVQFYSYPETFFDYDTFVKMPVPVQLIRSEATLVDSIKDSGNITGVVLGFDSFGNKMFALYNEIVRFTFDEIRDLRVGDKLGKGTDFVVFEIGAGEEGSRIIDLAYASSADTFCGYTLSLNTGNGLYEIRGSGNYVYSNIIGLAELPIAAGCEITDGYSVIVSDEVREQYEQTDKTGVPLFDTLYWFSQSMDQDPIFPQDYRQLANGWYCADGRFNATVIGGEIVKIHFFNS